MSKTTILDSIPEELRPQLIQEVKELLQQEQEKKDEVKKEITDIVDRIMPH